MHETIDLFVPLAEIDEPLGPRIERALGWSRGEAGELRVVRRSLDARKGRPLGHRLRVAVARRGGTLDPAAETEAGGRWPAGRPPPRVVVVGSGPAGSWAALRLAEAGVPVTILERGKPVQPRRRDLALLTRGELASDSNYCFGEGGAGTFSDGKLYTRAKDRPGVASVIVDLVRFGAPPEIAADARPHVGSNRLPRVLVALREHLVRLGVDYRFETQFTGLRVHAGRVCAALIEGGELPADIVVLAVGHSARPVYAWGAAAGIAI
ncbi:MAG TPA: FAD-dependent oxidoreductase, partial [Polyangia bacterium]|nr:FAD-dependent oxidoreductase [Polyangia bacterium]